MHLCCESAAPGWVYIYFMMVYFFKRAPNTCDLFQMILIDFYLEDHSYCGLLLQMDFIGVNEHFKNNLIWCSFCLCFLGVSIFIDCFVFLWPLPTFAVLVTQTQDFVGNKEATSHWSFCTHYGLFCTHGGSLCLSWDLSWLGFGKHWAKIIGLEQWIKEQLDIKIKQVEDTNIYFKVDWS